MGDRHPLTGEATKSAGRFPPRPSVARKQIAEASEQLEQLRAQHDGGGYSPEQQRVLREKMETLRQRKAALQPTPLTSRWEDKDKDSDWKKRQSEPSFDLWKLFWMWFRLIASCFAAFWVLKTYLPHTVEASKPEV